MYENHVWNTNRLQSYFRFSYSKNKQITNTTTTKLFYNFINNLKPIDRNQMHFGNKFYLNYFSILSYAYHHLHLIQPLINIMLYISTTFCYEINANCIEKRNNVVIKPPVVSMLQMYKT